MRVVTIAAEWYESGTFWTAAGVVVALLVGGASVLVGYIVGFPRRRLLYGMPTVAAMLAAPAGMRDDLELRHRGKVLTAPGVVEIWLVSRGRKDIPSGAYDSGKPLRVDVGARIVEVLQITSDPPSIPTPRVTVEETSLAIGPSLIGKRQKIMFTLLTEGGQPNLTCQSPLIDVQVREQDLEDLKPTPAWGVTLTMLAVLAAIATVWSLGAASTHRTAAAAAGDAASRAVVAAANDNSEARTAARASKAADVAAAAAIRQAKDRAAKGDSLGASAAKTSALAAEVQASTQRLAASLASAAAEADSSTARSLAAAQASASAAARTDILRAWAFGAAAAATGIAALAVWIMLQGRSRR